MRYKNFAAAILAVGFVVLETGVCGATVREDVDEKNGAAASSVVRRDNSDTHKIKLKLKNGEPVRLGSSAKLDLKNKKDSITIKSAQKAKTADKKSKSEDKDNDKVYFAGVELPKNYKNISIFGDAEATKEQAAALIKANNPEVRLECSVDELVELYWEEAGREGIRPDLALAQALVETGFFRYGGDVHHKQNNFCGLGTTGGGVRGAEFETPRLGVRAHVQHLLAYTQKKRPSTEIVDPRYEMAHRLRMERGMVDTWYGLNGTWAMGSNYSEKIMANYQKMLAIKDAPKLEERKGDDDDKDDKKSRKESKRREKEKRAMRKLVEKLLKERK